MRRLHGHRYYAGVDVGSDGGPLASIAVFDLVTKEFVYLVTRPKEEFEAMVKEVAKYYGEVPLLTDEGTWQKVGSDGKVYERKWGEEWKVKT